MNETILIGKGSEITSIPREEWERSLVDVPVRTEADLAFMSEEHHLVRNFVVLELPAHGKPLSPEFIAQELELPLDRVNVILEELERHLTFLFRNERGEVAWAYPVTTDVTLHRLRFSTGEEIYAA